MTPPLCSRTRIPRITPAKEHLRVCSLKMKLALESTWLQSFIEEIDCLFMSTGAIVDSSHSFANVQKLAQVSLPQDGWGSPCERRTTFARIKQNLQGKPRQVNIWYTESRIQPPQFMWCVSPGGMIQKGSRQMEHRREQTEYRWLPFRERRHYLPVDFKRKWSDAFVDELHKADESKPKTIVVKWTWTFEDGD